MMKQDWTTDEIIEHFTVLEGEQELIRANTAHNKLGKVLCWAHSLHPKLHLPQMPHPVAQLA